MSALVLTPEQAAWGELLGPLVAEYDAWCVENGFPAVAVEMQDLSGITAEQEAWLNDYYLRWDAASRAPSLPAALRASITDLESAKAWLRALHTADLTFHLEDDPATIINGRTGELLFSTADLTFLREQVAALYALEWGELECPIGFLLTLMEPNHE